MQNTKEVRQELLSLLETHCMGAQVESRKRRPAHDKQPSKVFRTFEPGRFKLLLIQAVGYARNEATGQQVEAEILNDFYTDSLGASAPASAFPQHLLSFISGIAEEV